MTLSRFLRDYLYFPLGGNRKGSARRYLNIMIVMTVGGLWHGAGWTFVLWGALHGFYLLVNHAWRAMRGSAESRSPWPGRVLTFLAVALAWVLFRADSFDAARSIYGGLIGVNGTALSADLLGVFGIHHAFGILGWTVTPLVDGQDAQWRFAVLCALGMVLVWAFPNSMVLTGFARAEPDGLTRRLSFKSLPRFAVATAALLFLCTSIINSGAVSEFIYYRF